MSTSELDKLLTRVSSMDAQELLNLLHDNIGYTDRELAETFNVGREHISRVRHGAKGASEALTTSVKNFAITGLTTEYTPTGSDAEVSEDNENTSVNWLLIGGIVFVGLVIVAGVIGYYRHKNETLEEKKPEDTTTSEDTQTS